MRKSNNKPSNQLFGKNNSVQNPRYPKLLKLSDNVSECNEDEF